MNDVSGFPPNISDLGSLPSTWPANPQASGEFPSLSDACPDDENATIDWDVIIETPPEWPTQTVTAFFVEQGERLPDLPEDPRD